MIGWKFPEGLVQGDMLKPAYASFRNQDMTRAFTEIPMNENFIPHLQWFEENCPNTFIWNSLRRVLKEATIMFQMLMGREATPNNMSRLTEICSEARKVADALSAWERHSEVVEEMATERRIFLLEMERHGLVVPEGTQSGAAVDTERLALAPAADDPATGNTEESLGPESGESEF